MPAIWTLDKPCDHALRFDRRAFDFRSAYLAHVHGCKFFVRRFAHVTEWILEMDLFVHKKQRGLFVDTTRAEPFRLPPAYGFDPRLGKALEMRNVTLVPAGRLRTSVSMYPFTLKKRPFPPNRTPGPRPTVRSLEFGTSSPLI